MICDRRRNLACQVAWSLLGTFYKWGGDDPSGFDCSGLIVEILKAVGILERQRDATAEELSRMYSGVLKPYKGCLVFYDIPIRHVEFCLDGEFAIGASGGGSNTLTIEDAIKNNAYVKIRPIKRERIIAGYVDPFKKNV